MLVRSIWLRTSDRHPLTSCLRLGRNLVAIFLPVMLAACGGGGSSTTPQAVAVTVAPTAASVVVGTGSEIFSATVANTTNTGVTWQVDGVAGGNTTEGTISASGVYAGPSSLPAPATVTVTAVSDADPTKSASATVTLMQSSISAVTAPTSLVASNATATGVTLTWGGLHRRCGQRRRRLRRVPERG